MLLRDFIIKKISKLDLVKIFNIFYIKQRGRPHKNRVDCLVCVDKVLLGTALKCRRI